MPRLRFQDVVKSGVRRHETILGDMAKNSTVIAKDLCRTAFLDEIVS